ncbi:acyl carrier protein [Amycolatopsis sp. NPDC021455]|uniref:acyl carrier protein n=1 Tax=Amycolatopsis sp. NPDC021455 TaxID=3154901 RepID=UPI003400A69A
MSITFDRTDPGTSRLTEVLADLMTRGGFPTTAAELDERPDAEYEAWGLDSLGHLELMVILGREFGITITDADAEQLRTPAATVRFLAALLRPGS